MRHYTEEEIDAIAARAARDPASLTLDEIQALGASRLALTKHRQAERQREAQHRRAVVLAAYHARRYPVDAALTIAGRYGRALLTG